MIQVMLRFFVQSDSEKIDFLNLLFFFFWGGGGEGVSEV